jgi:2-oxoglutarate ferredoxin oxidoreductase subunit alpha
MGEIRLMKGNEAIAEAAIRAGCDAYFGYPITPQSEIIEYLARQEPHKRTGMVLLQAESEIAAINMVYGAGGTGKKAMTSSSSPGISLMQEGISYMAGSEIPCLIVNIVRGGPGLGTIQPSQADYFQATKGGGHGDYKLIVLAPSSVQEMADFVPLAFDLAFKYRNPAMILSDGVIGQMMEKVELFEQMPRNKEFDQSWVTTGRKHGRERNILTSLDLDPARFERHNHHLQEKYRKMMENEVRYEKIDCDDAEYMLVAYGSAARICQKSIRLAREEGIKLGLIRPVTLFPFPYDEIAKLAEHVKGFMCVELNAGQMVEDVKLAVGKKLNVEFYGRMGGMIPTPVEILDVFKEKFTGE